MDRITFINEVKEHARRKAVTIGEMLSDSDPKGFGAIKIHQFQRILSQLSYWIEESKLNSLIKPYCDKDFFYYSEFFDVSKANTTKVTLSDEELCEFGQGFVTQGMPCFDWFQQYDPYHIGRISTYNFMRAAFCRRQLAEKVSIAYKFPGKDEIDYLTLSRDVNKIMSEKKQRTAQPTQSLTAQQASQLPPFFPAICESIRSSGLNPYNQFLVLDRYKHNRITPQQFINEFNSFGVKLLPNQTNQILQPFLVGNEVDYVLFCNEVSKYLSTHAPREAHPFQLVNIDTLLANISKDHQNRHSSLVENMKYFDQTNSGVIPIIRFVRAFSTANFQLTSPELEVLVKEFKIDDKMVNYKRFIDRIQPSAPPEKHDSTLNRLRSFLQSHYIKLEPILTRSDRSGSGYTTMSEIMFALRTISFDINDKETAILRQEIGNTANSRISIKEFCQKVDPEIEDRISSQRLSNYNSRGRSFDRSDPNQTSLGFTRTPYAPKPQRPAPPSEISEILGHLKFLAERQKIDLYQQFRQDDNLRSGNLVTTRFRSILLTIGCQNSEALILINFYKNQNDEGETVHYLDMFEDLKDVRPIPTQTIEPKTDISDQTKVLLIQIKGEMEKQSMVVDDFFNRYDTTYSFRVPKSRIPGILHSIGIRPPSQDQLQHFIDDFTDPRLPELFNYQRLIELLDDMHISHEQLASLKLDTAKSLKDKEIAPLINSIRERLYSRRKRPMNVFDGCNRNGITPREFRERISESGLILMEADMQKLLRIYKCNYNGDIDWLTFCQNVDSSKTVQME